MATGLGSSRSPASGRRAGDGARGSDPGRAGPSQVPAGPWSLHEPDPSRWPSHHADNLAARERVAAETFLVIDPLLSLSTAFAWRSRVWSLACAGGHPGRLRPRPARLLRLPLPPGHPARPLRLGRVRLSKNRPAHQGRGIGLVQEFACLEVVPTPPDDFAADRGEDDVFIVQVSTGERPRPRRWAIPLLDRFDGTATALDLPGGSDGTHVLMDERTRRSVQWAAMDSVRGSSSSSWMSLPLSAITPNM